MGKRRDISREQRFYSRASGHYLSIGVISNIKLAITDGATIRPAGPSILGNTISGQPKIRESSVHTKFDKYILVIIYDTGTDLVLRELLCSIFLTFLITCLTENLLHSRSGCHISYVIWYFTCGLHSLSSLHWYSLDSSWTNLVFNRGQLKCLSPDDHDSFDSFQPRNGRQTSLEI